MAKYALLLALALLSAATSILATPCALRNFKCVNKTQLCFGKSVYDCPENFECRDGGSAFNNPCKHVKPALCPGGYSRYQCISSKTFCNGGRVQVCAPRVFCQNGNGGSPCSITARDLPTTQCPKGDRSCASGTEYCLRGLLYPCPAGYICRGKWPCIKRAP